MAIFDVRGVVISGVDGADDVAVKPPSTAAVAADPALVVAVSPNNPITASMTPSTASAVTQVPGTVALTTLLASNAARRGATLYNDGNTPWFIKLGAAASATSFTVKLLKDVYYEVPFNYTGIITGLQSVANGNLYVTELT